MHARWVPEYESSQRAKDVKQEEEDERLGSEDQRALNKQHAEDRADNVREKAMRRKSSNDGQIGGLDIGKTTDAVRTVRDKTKAGLSSAIGNLEEVLIDAATELAKPGPELDDLINPSMRDLVNKRRNQRPR